MTRISPTAGRLLLWVVNTALVLIFLTVGAAKFLLPEMWQDHFVNRWGLPSALVTRVGWLEVIGAVLLLPRSTAPLGGALLAVIMAGATATHLLHGQYIQAPVSFALLVLAAWVAVRRKEMAAVERALIDEEQEPREEGDSTPS